LPQSVVQHVSPSRRIVQSNAHGVLHESGDVCCLSRRYQSANFLNLIVVKGDGDLLGRHTKYHTIEVMAVMLPGQYTNKLQA